MLKKMAQSSKIKPLARATFKDLKSRQNFAVVSDRMPLVPSSYLRLIEGHRQWFA